MTDPSPHPFPRPNLARRGLLAATALVVLVVGGSLLKDSQWDLPVVQALNELHVGTFAHLTTTVYFLLDPPGAITLGGIITLSILVTGLARHRPLRDAGLRALAYAATLIITWLPITLFKAIFTRPRPEMDLLPHPFIHYEGDNSYPSGHTSFATIAVVALVLWVATTRRTRIITVIIGACWIAWVILVVVSNGVHFPTDAAASLMWGLCVTPLVAGVLQLTTARLLRPRPV